MKYTKTEVGVRSTHPPEHAVRPTPFPGNGSQRIIPRRASGWDPYEVWRTRVMAPRDEARGMLLHLGRVG